MSTAIVANDHTLLQDAVYNGKQDFVRILLEFGFVFFIIALEQLGHKMRSHDSCFAIKCTLSLIIRSDADHHIINIQQAVHWHSALLTERKTQLVEEKKA